MTNITKHQRGVTLIELMIVVAIIAIISAIAIPAYQGYLLEARLGVARVNADSLRIFLEDFQLDNGTYRAGGATTFNTAAIEANFGWSPDGDSGNYSYTVTAATTSYDIVVQHSNGDWIRCENRMESCCDNTGTGSITACP